MLPRPCQAVPWTFRPHGKQAITAMANEGSAEELAEVSLHTYIPQDRLHALAHGRPLPDRTHGAALFADISGFTALTEQLRGAFGARRGAEELTHHLGLVYSALITELEKFDGSVVSFAGDAMTCWLDGADAPERAVTCAFDLQSAMAAFAAIALPGGGTASLSLKVCVATGAARRLVVGDPSIGCIDALAGATVTRTSTGEHLARGGEIVVDDATAKALGDGLATDEWRIADTGEAFAVARALMRRAPTTERAALPPLDPELLKPWVDLSVFERERSGRSTFLTEFRPGAVLFVNFAGIDYDADDAQPRLDAFAARVQRSAARYGGTVLQLAIGDKGSYAYVSFGALTAHEDDARRAVATARALMQVSDLQLRIGIAQGVMRVGAYGGVTRRTYGALGDEVNLAARLMTTAKVGEILISGAVHKSVEGAFTLEPRPPLTMKGKAEPLPVFVVTGERRHRAIRLQEPSYALPMVGRVNELELVNARLDLAAKGTGQIVAIVSDAGMGKSRLVAEIVRNARHKGFTGFGGACRSDGSHTPYHAWKSVWQAFFGVDPEHSTRKQMRLLEGEIDDRAPERVDAMPLLNVVLDLQVPDNDFTEHLEPKARQGALHALLEACLKAAAEDEPILIVLEDLHWVDALSLELLEQLAAALAGHPVAFVLAYRPAQRGTQASRLEALPQFTRIALHELTLPEAEQAIRAKLAQLYPARSGALPPGLVAALMARAQGNPFYIEELLNYVRDRGLDPSALDHIELPDSLHALILSRIDQLSEAEKVALRVASVVGRLFRADWLTGYYPELGALPTVRSALDALARLDITPLDSPAPEWRYVFKHIVTHEVTYESLPFATRARLHEQLAHYLETTDAPVEAIAFHYGRTGNTGKRIEYLQKAGELAQRNFANESALDYYTALLPLLADGKARFLLHLRRGQVAELMGRYDAAEGDYRAALASAGDDPGSRADAQFALGRLTRLRGEYGAALEWLALAHESRTRLQDTRGLGQGLIERGMIMNRMGESARARATLGVGIAMAREAGDAPSVAQGLNSLGQVAWSCREFATARTYFEESMILRRGIGEKSAIAASLSNLGAVALAQDDFASARPLLEESLATRREIGDKWGVATSLNNLDALALWQGDYVRARALFDENLVMRREMGDKDGIALSLYNLGNVALAEGEFAQARALTEDCLALYRDMGDKSGVASALLYLGFAALAVGDLDPVRPWLQECLSLGREIEDTLRQASALLGLGLADHAEGKPGAGDRVRAALLVAAGDTHFQTSCLIAMAALSMQEGAPEFSAQLLGAVRSTLTMQERAVEPLVNFLYAQTLPKVRAALGDAAFDAAWAEGNRWTLADAVLRVSEAKQ